MSQTKKELQVEYLDKIITSLNDIKEKIINDEEVNNDDWIIPATTLREAIPLFMYNNPDFKK